MKPWSLVLKLLVTVPRPKSQRDLVFNRTQGETELWRSYIECAVFSFHHHGDSVNLSKNFSKGSLEVTTGVGMTPRAGAIPTAVEGHFEKQRLTNVNWGYGHDEAIKYDCMDVLKFKYLSLSNTYVFAFFVSFSFLYISLITWNGCLLFFKNSNYF